MSRQKEEKTERLSIRVTASQLELWNRAAGAADREFSDWIRVALNHMATAELDAAKGKKKG